MTTLGRVDPDPLEPGAVRIGVVNLERSGLVLDVDTDHARVELDGDIVDVDFTLNAGEYTELELYAVHRGFDADRTMRGDMCVTGRTLGAVPPNYLERHEDAQRLEEVGFSGSVEGELVNAMYETPSMPADDRSYASSLTGVAFSAALPSLT